jgi:hypothetical protein
MQRNKHAAKPTSQPAAQCIAQLSLVVASSLCVYPVNLLAALCLTPGGNGLRLGPEVTAAAQQLLSYLVLVGYSAEREVRKANAEYIKVLLSRWGPRAPLTGEAPAACCCAAMMSALQHRAEQ